MSTFSAASYSSSWPTRSSLAHLLRPLRTSDMRVRSWLSEATTMSLLRSMRAMRCLRVRLDAPRSALPKVPWVVAAGADVACAFGDALGSPDISFSTSRSSSSSRCCSSMASLSFSNVKNIAWKSRLAFSAAACLSSSSCLRTSSELLACSEDVFVFVRASGDWVAGMGERTAAAATTPLGIAVFPFALSGLCCSASSSSSSSSSP